MKEKVTNFVGSFAVKLGEYSVGKSLFLGMFDPNIPQQLKDEIRQDKK